MYIPQKSGHVSHTIKNYLLGELERYIRYNSLKLFFLKIRTLLFSKFRNHSFKKIWLRKQIATLKYEYRKKLSLEKEPDSTFSHSACQIVLEKKAESLRTKRSRLADPCLSHNDNPTNSLFPMEPHRIKIGMFYGHFNQEVQSLSLQQQSNDKSSVVIQGLPWEKLHPGIFLQKPIPTEAAEKTGITAMAPTEVVEEKGRGRTMKAEESDETRTIYLVMPSYAEPYKRQIMQILAKEKTNLCKSKTFDKVFFNITFKIEIMIIILN